MTTPLETSGGNPLTWVGVNPSPPGSPTVVTVALAAGNYASDAGITPAISDTLDT